MSSTFISNPKAISPKTPAGFLPALLVRKVWLPRGAYELVPYAWLLAALASVLAGFRLGILTPWALVAAFTGLLSLAMGAAILWARLRHRRRP